MLDTNHKWYDRIDPFYGMYEDDDPGDVLSKIVEEPNVVIRHPNIPIRTEKEIAELFYGPCPSVHKHKERDVWNYWMSSHIKTLQ